MSLIVDPNHPWRSSAFAKVPVIRLGHGDVQRGSEPTPYRREPVGVVNSESTKAWLDELDCCRVSELSARDGMISGWMEVTTEVGSTKRGSADNSVAHVNLLPYEYGAAAATQLHMSYAGRHFIARPAIDETIVSAMYSADSADKWVTAAGIKLPRVTADSTRSSSVLLGSTEDNRMQASKFEGLRRLMAECAKKDDYGDRLFNMARVVCHATVMAKMRLKSEFTPAMVNQNCGSVLSAMCPGLSQDEVQENVFVYTHTDESDDYRAFLTMGVRGVQGYVGVARSIYSQCLVEAEAKENNTIWFVRVAGAERKSWHPPADAYMRVLDNPDVCMAYYYAYARSMGLGHVATAILSQAAIGPHVWMKDAVSPYKNCRPKLDAARYVILPTSDKAEVTLTTPSVLVNQAAVVGAAIKAGLGGTLMAFKSGKDIDSQALMAGVMQKLSDPETRRTVMHAITSRYRNGAVGLEWLSPFSYNVREGVTSCVKAWRDYGFMIADYNICPISVLSGCVHGGVDMTNSLIGRGTVVNERAYAQLVMCCLAAGAELPGLCERPTAGLLATVHSMATKLREWQPVINVVHMRGSEPTSDAQQVTPPKTHKPREPSTTTETATSSSRLEQSEPPPMESREVSPKNNKKSRPMVPEPTYVEQVKLRPMKQLTEASSSEPDLPVTVTHGKRLPTRHDYKNEPSSSSSSGHRRTISGTAPRPLLGARLTSDLMHKGAPISRIEWGDTESEAHESTSNPQAAPSLVTRRQEQPTGTMRTVNSPAQLRTTQTNRNNLLTEQGIGDAAVAQQTSAERYSNSSGSLSSETKTVRKAADNMDI